MSWKIIDYEGYTEIFPLDEEYRYDHLIWESNGEIICDCECKPEPKMDGERLTIIHNSFDGREGVEWAEQILKNENKK